MESIVRQMELLPASTIEIDPACAMMLISAIQLVCRHPNFIGPTRTFVEQFARDLTMHAFPEGQLQEYANLGWNQDLDVPVERQCIYCGCTDSAACEGGCHWVEQHRCTRTGVCSNCAGIADHDAFRVTELFLWLGRDEEGNEVTAVVKGTNNRQEMLIAADAARLASLAKMLPQAEKDLGRTLSLFRFSAREAWAIPEGKK